jgi:hypothetical protein
MKNKITFAALLVFISIGALFFGSVIGQSRFVDLSVYGLVALFFLYLSFLYKFTWQIVLFLVWSGVNLNYGFRLGSEQYATAILLVYGIIIFLLRRNPYPNPDFFKRVNGKSLFIWSGILLLYGTLTFALNKTIPFDGGSYSTKNMLKAYSSTFAPVLVLFFALRMPYTFRVGKNAISTIIWILAIGLVLNFANTIHLFRQGYGGFSILTDESGDVGMFYIPLINATLGVFTMRVLAPTSVIFAFAFLCHPGWFKAQALLLKVLVVSVLGMGLLGSVVSGGRAAVLLSLLYAVIIAFLNRRIIFIFVAICLVFLVVLFANIFSKFINNDMPSFVARPLQYVMIEKGSSMRSIENSSDYRTTLFLEALKEWRDDSRVFLFGRSVYTAMDYIEVKKIVGDKESFLMVNINSGTCHALLPSVLIQYGIFGGVLYYLVYCMMFWYFLRSYQIAKRDGYSEELRIISFVLALSTGLEIITATIGGSWFGTFHILMVILIKSIAARDEMEYYAAQKAEEKDSSSPLDSGPSSIGSRPGFA